MNRRNFLKLLVGAVGGVVIAEAIPFNRVWSFPSNIVIPEVTIGQYADFYPSSIVVVTSELSRLATIYYDRKMLDNLRYNLIGFPGGMEEPVTSPDS